jgi:hypothetical protein
MRIRSKWNRNWRSYISDKTQSLAISAKNHHSMNTNPVREQSGAAQSLSPIADSKKVLQTGILCKIRLPRDQKKPNFSPDRFGSRSGSPASV